MSKILILCVVLAVSCLQCIRASDASHVVLASNNLTSINFADVDSLSTDKTRFITTANINDTTVVKSEIRGGEVDNYYKWLDFLKNSPVTHASNSTEKAKIHSINEEKQN